MLNVYVDETGERSNGEKQGNSLIFGMAAVLVTPASDKELQLAIGAMRLKFGIPDNVVMSSKKHLRTEDRRRFAANLLSEIKDIRVVFVYALKSEISGNYIQDKTLFYNYVAMQTYKRILWAARDWKGASELVRVAFGHVRGHDHETTQAYLRSQIPLQPKVPGQMAFGIKWVSASKYISSQAADIYASFIGKLLDPVNTESFHLELFEKIWPQIRKGPFGCASNLGVMSMPQDVYFINSPWNFCLHCREKR
jgi:hypothetical protein